MNEPRPEALWPADKVERWPLAKLLPSARNARTHSPEQVEQLAASMREWGWTNPVLIAPNGEIIAGHGRVMAAKLLGFEQVPVMIAEGWTEAQIRAYRLADNKLALNGGWDWRLLQSELSALQGFGFNAALIGFSEDELYGLAAQRADGGAAAGSLAARFGVPPFSVLNAREGWWQERKAAWIALGIKSELGRGEGSAPGGSLQPKINGHGGISRSDSHGREVPGSEAKFKRASNGKTA